MGDTLLAGPILRRATEKRVCVWFSTKQAFDVRLDVLTTSNEMLGQSNTDKLYSQRTQLGENLVIYLLEARCPDDLIFPVDEILYYRIVTISADGRESAFDLSQLAYPEFDMPSFYISSEINKLLHGSCRKPHGSESNEDALAQGDTFLEKTASDIQQRPALLLLTGDQIYADDVSISLLAMLRKKGSELIGSQELLPTSNDDSLSTPTNIDPTNIPLHGREDFLEDYKSGFSSSKSENHLLTFGEFAAMYIYVFGNRLGWRVETDWNTLESEGVSNLEDAKKAFDEQSKSIKTFESTLPNVRRLLANIPTYMIFDDHDVTDDWNITNMWYDEVRDSVLGHRVVSNALAAFWAFQGCGNDPDNFDVDFKSAISNHLLGKAPQDDASEYYDLQTWKQRRWGFSVPTSPPIIAIDSRTQRETTINSYLPNLLDRYARDWLAVEWLKLKTNPKVTLTESPIFIAMTPVMGFTVIEVFQRIIMLCARYVDSFSWLNKGLGRFFGGKGYVTRKVIRKADIEAWSSNNKSLLSFLDCLSWRMKIKRCVFLSGDVHYAFTAVGRYRKDNRSMDCYQLTSSALKNSPNDIQSEAIEKAGKFKGGVSIHRYFSTLRIPFWLPIKILQPFLPRIFSKYFWDTQTHLLAADTQARIMSECNLGLVEFEKGIPVKHSLKSSQGDEVFKIINADQVLD